MNKMVNSPGRTWFTVSSVLPSSLNFLTLAEFFCLLWPVSFLYHVKVTIDCLLQAMMHASKVQFHLKVSYDLVLTS